MGGYISGGRTRRRRSITHRLWLAVAFLVGFLLAVFVLFH
jgi:hypothetical protein